MGDGSNFITFDELVNCIRRELKKGPTLITHTELMALWCGLDTSGDNMVTRDEAAEFFKLGQKRARSERKQHPMLRFAGRPGQLVSPIERHGMSRAIPTDSTAQMAESLRIEGHSLPDDDELNHIARRLTKW